MSRRVEFSRRIKLLVLIAAVCGGCGGGDEQLKKRGSVTGMVTFDGQPLATGRITFTAKGKEGGVTGAEIENGVYEIPREKGPVAGSHQVSITSPQKTGQQIPAVMPAKEGTMIDVVVESIPDKYNTRTTLTAEIKAGENLAVNFDLKKDL